MDFYSVAVSAVAGAIAGGIFGYAGFKFKENNKKKKWLMGLGAVCFVIISNVGQTPKVKAFFMSAFDENYAIKQRLLKDMEPLVEIPQIKEKLKKIKTYNEAKMLTQTLVYKGIKRLPAEDLMTWNRIRYEMTKVSKKLCASFWKGGATENDILSAMSKIKEESYKDLGTTHGPFPFTD